MLVLSRQLDEVIEIQCPDGTIIEVGVVDIRHGSDGGKVRLGVTAPKEYFVHRREIADRIRSGERGPWRDHVDPYVARG